MNRIYLVIILITFSYHINSGVLDDYGIRQKMDLLDQYIDEKSEYDIKKDERIHTLLNKLSDNTLSLEEQYSLTYSLFDEYSTFQYNLMVEYAKRLIDLSQQLNDKEKLVRSQVCLGYSHLWGGAFKDAYEYSITIDTTKTSVDTQAVYLMFLLDLDYECGLYTKHQRHFFKSYENKMLKTIARLEKLLPADDDRVIEAKQKECFHSDKFRKAYNYLLTRMQQPDGSLRQKAVKIGDAGFMNLELGDTIAAIDYMVQAAILDIRIGSRQTPALRKISETLYAKGDLIRAYKYIQLSMDNAQFFDSKYRMYESSISLPAIDKELYELTKRQKEELTIAIVVIIIFIIALFISILFILKQNRKLKSSRLLIEEQNMSLLEINQKIKDINHELFEANSIKETYLGRVLSDNSAYITKIEELYQTVERKIKVKQYDDIMNFLAKSNYRKERKIMLESFDKMFLALFPDFIERFNSLLKEQDKIVAVNGSLTPELRIFALVRLGITKSDTIAEILNYSASTVRNYKTKIRNISIVPNDEFDMRLMDVETKKYT